MAIEGLAWKIIKPTFELSDLIESFWMLENNSDLGHEMAILPDGRVDVHFTIPANEGFTTPTLMGIQSKVGINVFPPREKVFAVSLTLLGLEMFLNQKYPDLLDNVFELPTGFWGISADDLSDFDHFVTKVSTFLLNAKPEEIDSRKQKLFELVYASRAATVAEISQAASWSSRQINRYFQAHFGISLKAYCGILRFSTSLSQVKLGKLFPELNYADQAHFIREVKKYAEATPSELRKNDHDRFIHIHLSSIPPE